MEIKKRLTSDNILKGAMVLGIWILVLQNFGILATSQRVRVVNDVGVHGSVDIDNSISVSIDDEVDVNIRHINGWAAANYYSYKRDGQEYHSLGVAQ